MPFFESFRYNSLLFYFSISLNSALVALFRSPYLPCEETEKLMYVASFKVTKDFPENGEICFSRKASLEEEFVVEEKCLKLNIENSASTRLII